MSTPVIIKHTPDNVKEIAELSYNNNYVGFENITKSTNPVTPLNSSKNYEPFIIMLEKAGGKDGKTLSPMLTLLVNPKSFDRTYDKVFSEQYTANKVAVELSGESPDILQFSGSLGGFYTEQTGLTRLYRANSASYRNLMFFLKYFKNNSYTYEKDAVNLSTTKRNVSPFILSRNPIRSIGNVLLYYRREIFLGYFENLTISEDANKPYTLEYDFNFHVRKYINRDMPSGMRRNRIEGHTTNPPNSGDLGDFFQGVGNILNFFGF